MFFVWGLWRAADKDFQQATEQAGNHENLLSRLLASSLQVCPCKFIEERESLMDFWKDFLYKSVIWLDG